MSHVYSSRVLPGVILAALMAIDDTKVNAEFKDGILNVRLPKSEKAKPKSVEVKIN